MIDPKEKIKLIQGRIQAFERFLRCCTLCPRRCKIDRASQRKRGFCRSGSKIRIYNYMIHSGEEPVISGKKGSGVIFFSNCTMACVYCQNYQFSHLSEGKDFRPEALCDMMIELYRTGCHNINLVTPTHYLPHIILALLNAYKKGLNIPIVYNTSGYELVDTLKLLEGIVDIYLSDMRYSDNEWSFRYSGVWDYPEVNLKAIKEMFRQVGALVIDNDGIAQKGLLIRHLILPGGLSQTEAILRTISRISKDLHISLMSQYYPVYRAKEFSEINRRITKEEYEKAVGLLYRYKILKGWIQFPPDQMDLELAGSNIKSRF